MYICIYVFIFVSEIRRHIPPPAPGRNKAAHPRLRYAMLCAVCGVWRHTGWLRKAPPSPRHSPWLKRCSLAGRGYADVSPRGYFYLAPPTAVMTRRPQPISARLLGGDAPSDADARPCCGVHVRRPFCLFGHVTPHGPILACLDAVTSPQPRWPRRWTRHSTKKMNVASAPYTTHFCQATLCILYVK